MTSKFEAIISKMDVLYRFSVLNTAISTIFKEIADKIRQMGSSWHFCLFIWTLYFGIEEIRRDLFNIGLFSAMMFIGASLYLVLVDYTRLLKFNILKYVAKVCLYVSLPFVIAYYVWQPLNRAVSCMLNRLFGECDESFSSIVSAILAVVFTILFCIYDIRRKKSGEESTKVKTRGSPVQRRVSARVLAMKQRQQSPMRWGTSSVISSFLLKKKTFNSSFIVLCKSRDKLANFVI